MAYRRYYVCGTFKNNGSAVYRSNGIKADTIEKAVFDRLRVAVTNPKVLWNVDPNYQWDMNVAMRGAKTMRVSLGHGITATVYTKVASGTQPAHLDERALRTVRHRLEGAPDGSDHAEPVVLLNRSGGPSTPLNGGTSVEFDIIRKT